MSENDTYNYAVSTNATPLHLPARRYFSADCTRHAELAKNRLQANCPRSIEITEWPQTLQI